MNKENVTTQPTEAKNDKKPESLDDLIELVEGDELRHVIGGGRTKTGPFATA